jgi:hypothetical protein
MAIERATGSHIESDTFPFLDAEYVYGFSPPFEYGYAEFPPYPFGNFCPYPFGKFRA